MTQSTYCMETIIQGGNKSIFRSHVIFAPLAVTFGVVTAIMMGRVPILWFAGGATAKTSRSPSALRMSAAA